MKYLKVFMIEFYLANKLYFINAKILIEKLIQKFKNIKINYNSIKEEVNTKILGDYKKRYKSIDLKK